MSLFKICAMAIPHYVFTQMRMHAEEEENHQFKKRRKSSPDMLGYTTTRFYCKKKTTPTHRKCNSFDRMCALGVKTKHAQIVEKKNFRMLSKK